MDANSALVDDFLTSRGSPSVGLAASHSSPPPSHYTQQQQQQQHPMMAPNTIKRIFQLQSHLTSLILQARQCINELQAYNMFPEFSDDEQGNQEIAGIIVSLLQQSEPPMASMPFSPQPPLPPQQPQQQQQQSMGAYTSQTTGMPSWESESKKTMNDRAHLDTFGVFGGGAKTTTANESDAHGGFGAPAVGEAITSSDMVRSSAADARPSSGARNTNNNNNNPAELPMAFVEFKRSRYRKFICDDPTIEPGSYVLVDGDRGTDCGLLVQMIHHLPGGETSVVCMDGCDIKEEKVKLESGRVIREATEAEVDRLHNTIAAAEAVALKTCRQRCIDLGIDIDLIDVEYQFDMKKIAFYFDCDHSVDFRTLVRELYRTFGARIWMENVHPKVKNAVPEAANNGTEEEFNYNNSGSGGGGRYYGRGGGGGRGNARGGGRNKRH